MLTNANLLTNIALTPSEMPSGIDAVNIGGGDVSNTEFGYLDGVTSSIQTQINALSGGDPWSVANTLDAADSTARLALTYGTGEGEVQVGDLVRQTDTGVVYLLIGDTPSNAAHWQQISALPASIIASGQVALARGGTGSDLSATGGSGQVLQQSTAGGAVTVGTIGLDFLADVACSGGILDFGNSSTPVTTIFGGKGASDASPVAFGLRGTGGSGTNVAGGDLNLDAGPGTGNAATGTGRLRATSAGSSGSTLQSSWVNALTWGRSEVVLGLSLRTVSAGINLDYQGSLAPASGGYTRLSGANGIYFNAASADRMFLTSSGLSVGHATAASAPLHVRGTSAQQIWEYSSGINATLTVDANGHLGITHTGNRLGIGYTPTVSANYSTGIGYGPNATGTSSLALGHGPTASGNYSIAAGYASTASGDFALAQGYQPIAAGDSSIALGRDANSSANDSISIGRSATTTTAKVSSIAIGHGATSSANQSIAIGYTPTASANYATAIGYSAVAAGNYSVALGVSATANSVNAVAVGGDATCSGIYGMALGYASSAGANEIALGSSVHTKLGVMGTTPAGRGSAWSITNGAGARRTFDTSSVTLPELAEVVATLLSHLGDTAGFGFLDTNY